MTNMGCLAQDVENAFDRVGLRFSVEVGSCMEPIVAGMARLGYSMTVEHGDHPGWAQFVVLFQHGRYRMGIGCALGLEEAVMKAAAWALRE